MTDDWKVGGVYKGAHPESGDQTELQLKQTSRSESDSKELLRSGHLRGKGRQRYRHEAKTTGNEAPTPTGKASKRAAPSVVRTQPHGFISHLRDWIEYLLLVIDRRTAALTEAEQAMIVADNTKARRKAKADAEGAKAERAKYRRQLRWLLGFVQGTNLELGHNLQIAAIYAGASADPIQDDIGDQAALDALLRAHAPVCNWSVPALEPIQGCYRTGPNLPRSPAFIEIEKALASPALFFLQGPPGTGKTTVIAEICTQQLRLEPKSRILIVSETHVAVDNALDRIGLVMQDLMQDNPMLDTLLRYPDFNPGSVLECEAVRRAGAVTKETAVWYDAGQQDPVLAATLWQRLTRGHSPDQREEGVDADDDGRKRRVQIPRWQGPNLADQHQIVGVTCNQIEHLIDPESTPYDLVIVDEVSKATLPEWLMAVSVANKAILVGDAKQLPPTFCQNESEVLDSMDQLQAKLIRNGVIEQLFVNAPVEMKGVLLTQYRMQPNIGALVSKHFYDGKLQHGRNQTEDPSQNLGFFSYQSDQHFPDPALPKAQRRLKNPIEVDLIAQIMQKLTTEKGTTPEDGKKVKKRSVAIITPYKAQAMLLRVMVKELAQQSDLSTLTVEVDTVDSFQGREADIVIFSFVRNNGSATFYGDPRRMNVALSRARDRVYLVGDQRYLASQRRYNVLTQLASLPQLDLATLF